MTDMAAAHQRDYADHRRMQDMSRTIAAFLADPPKRAHPFTLATLTTAREGLDRACERIVLTWN